MPRRNILEVIEDIKKVLSKEKEMSVKRISEKIKSQWETTIKALEFMKKQGMVKEKQGKKTHKIERLFSLK
jgi:Mn-dependent DtxR family transcriptional regulator